MCEALKGAGDEIVVQVGSAQGFIAGCGSEVSGCLWGKAASVQLTATPPSLPVRVEISLGESGLQYLPGDALGVWPSNDPQARADGAGSLLSGRAAAGRFCVVLGRQVLAATAIAWHRAAIV